ncbi:alkyldihydroxyacetonephosphate synthase [Coccinella septempunctata]|uniref:alkyldihydroxyacetonephosphate synthase n=1 Tax=Coccinella septempunctata TaxID=41139 RepID=UPI001D07475B|nr:alkyldihydroxyacetonephosphate synthase [Coccinella septempunctata]
MRSAQTGCASESSKEMTERQERKKFEGIVVKSAVPKYRQDLLKWNGWGYKDSKFNVENDGDVKVWFTGDRYPIAGKFLPHFRDWVSETFNIDLANPPALPQEIPVEDRFPKPNVSREHLQEIYSLNISTSLKGIDRLVRAHGQTLNDIFTLRTGMFQRIPDVVLWPTSHEDVVRIVELANRLNLVVLVFGGGTAVSGAVECPVDEPRTIISLDTSQMNRILWVDKENLVACFESGIIGQDLERELREMGFTTGHEPDSYEFSSLGGWVATRASGMKKNIYGNIEDLLVHVKMVTAKGVLEKNCQVPRMSCGPDFNHVVLGSEGSLGVITEVILKIRPLPKCRKYGSIVFPSFEMGLKTMREVARRRCQPASIRLMDNEQFKFGLILKPDAGRFAALLDIFKKFYITKIKGYGFNTLCVMTLLFEGDEDEVKDQEKKVYGIAGQFGGFPAGETNGERGYMLTFVIAYLRDIALQYRIVAESFETSVPWDRALILCANVKRRVAEECRKRSIEHFLVSCRVTQTYDAGCVIYFYFGFNHSGIADPVSAHHDIESCARDEIVANGGSISHHHGVGKLRKKWYPETVSEVGVGLFMATKNELDPQNIFASNNLVKSKL